MGQRLHHLFRSVLVELAALPPVDDRLVILLHPPLHLAGASIAMGREGQQNGSLANGHNAPPPEGVLALPPAAEHRLEPHQPDTRVGLQLQ